MFGNSQCPPVPAVGCTAVEELRERAMHQMPCWSKCSWAQAPSAQHSVQSELVARCRFVTTALTGILHSTRERRTCAAACVWSLCTAFALSSAVGL